MKKASFIDMMFFDDVGEVIRYLRENNEMTQAELAKKLNMSTTRLGRIERGQSYIFPDEITAAARYFKVPTDLILLNNCEEVDAEWEGKKSSSAQVE